MGWKKVELIDEVADGSLLCPGDFVSNGREPSCVVKVNSQDTMNFYDTENKYAKFDYNWVIWESDGDSNEDNFMESLATDKQPTGSAQKSEDSDLSYDSILTVKAIEYVHGIMDNPAGFTSDHSIIVDAAMHIVSGKRWSYGG